jgi:hypothetical protein
VYSCTDAMSSPAWTLNITTVFIGAVDTGFRAQRPVDLRRRLGANRAGTERNPGDVTKHAQRLTDSTRVVHMITDEPASVAGCSRRCARQATMGNAGNASAKCT